jgi:hypothetical protein
MTYDYATETSFERCQRLLAEAEQCGAYVLFADATLKAFSRLMFGETEDDQAAFNFLNKAVAEFLTERAVALGTSRFTLRQAWSALVKEAFQSTHTRTTPTLRSCNN